MVDAHIKLAKVLSNVCDNIPNTLISGICPPAVQT